MSNEHEETILKERAKNQACLNSNNNSAHNSPHKKIKPDPSAVSQQNLQQDIERLESEVRGYVRQFPAVFTKAAGSTLTDSEGNKYIDFFCGAGSLNYGHNNHLAKKALLQYIHSDGIQHSLDTATAAKIEFIQAFEQIILKPRKLDYKIQFTGPTGTNAVEAAIKLAKKYTKRSHVIAFTNAYHGHTLGSLALTGNDYYHNDFYGARSNVSHLPFDGYLENLDTSLYLDQVLDDSSSGIPIPAAIILETIQGEGGVNVASHSWLQRVQEICKKHQILLIVDDIQAGNGRSGKFFSFEDSAIEPDIVCLSKSIGGGLPLSINLLNPEIDIWNPGEHTGTFRGNNLAFIAGRAVLDYWTVDFEKQISRRENLIKQQLISFCRHYSAQSFQYRGKGMIWGLDVGRGDLAEAIIKECFASGLLIESCGSEGQVIKIMAALTIDLDLLEKGLGTLEQAIHSVLTEPMS